MGFLEFPEFFEKFPEFRDSLGISGEVRSTGGDALSFGVFGVEK